MPLNPSTPSSKFVACPLCVDGYELDPNNNRLCMCSLCLGGKAVTPYDICNCGRSCLITRENIFYCGRKECFDAIHRNLVLAESEDEWWAQNAFGNVHSHRRGQTGFGGGRNTSFNPALNGDHRLWDMDGDTD